MTGFRRSGFLSRTEWSSAQLDAERLESQARFRYERLQEPLEEYLDAFEQVQDAVENLLESTTDLARLDDEALTVLIDPTLREAFRYLAGPPISVDDLKTLADVTSLSPRAMISDPDLVRRLVDTIEPASIADASHGCRRVANQPRRSGRVRFSPHPR